MNKFTLFDCAIKNMLYFLYEDNQINLRSRATEETPIHFERKRAFVSDKRQSGKLAS